MARFSSWIKFVALIACVWVLPQNQVHALTTEVGVDGEVPTEYAALAAQLKQAWPQMPEQEAVDVAAMIQTIRADPESQLLIKRMTEGSGKAKFDAFVKDLESPKEIAVALSMQLQEMAMLEVLFKDPQRAVAEMKKEGMLPAEKIEEYEKNPALLEEETRKSQYFTFLSIAAAGGFL